MKMRRGVLAAAVTAALLAACGGGNPDPGGDGPSGAPSTVGSFTAVVSFGDSLSDVGTYSPATSLAGNGSSPYLGGKFTTNTDSSTGDLIWVERVAATLGITITPADMGFAGQSQACPAATINPALAGTCTAYGQGGSRVTDPEGIGHTKDGAPAALTVPVATQIDRHLERFGSFKDSDLVIIWAGNNDAFIQLQTFVATATSIQTQVATGAITAERGNKLLYDAQSAAQEGMKEAAFELAGYVKNKILAHGGKYVAIGNLPNSALTPQFQAYPASIQGVLKTITETFNLWLREGLDDLPVQIIDMASIGAAVNAAPASYGFTNITTPACSATKISLITGGQITDGSSLFCNATTGMPYNGLSDGADTSTWFFADGVHPTSGGHAYYADQILTQLRAFGWVAAPAAQ
ncbi:SGNH/GDSL hydrolase family protein [Rubrivivax gelatinosus]|nr:SGNH/GDSL hydrolase family protein [Rubrivivax gelatinosus]